MDFFAEDARRVLKQCKAPLHWDDEEALFLLRLVLDEDFMNDVDCKLDENVRTNRTMQFVALNIESQGKLFRILYQLDNAVKKRISRKGGTARVWLLLADHSRRVQELVGCLAECKNDNPDARALIPKLREAIDLFWDSKAENVVDFYSHSPLLHRSDLKPKDVERARAAIREMVGFKNRKRVPTPEELDEWASKRRMRQLRMQRMSPAK